MDASKTDNLAKKALKVTLEPHPERRIKVITQTGEEEYEPYALPINLAFFSKYVDVPNRHCKVKVQCAYPLYS